MVVWSSHRLLQFLQVCGFDEQVLVESNFTCPLKTLLTTKTRYNQKNLFKLCDSTVNVALEVRDAIEQGSEVGHAIE